MLITPPTSIMPEIYRGREEYEFEINFYNLYSQATQSVVTLQKRWDNLQYLANEWLDTVLINYQDTTVQAYLNDESIEIERIKDANNDKLVQLKLTFTMSGFTKCFRPQSTYPSSFSNLAVWLRADSGVTFDSGTKKVSLWEDKSGNSNNVEQTTSADQPIFYDGGGANGRPYVGFEGDTTNLESSSYCPITTDFTIIMAAKVFPSGSLTNIYSLDFDVTDDYLDCGSSSIFSFGDGATDNAFSVSAWISTADPTSSGIISKDETSKQEWHLAFDNNDKIRFRLYDGSSNYITTITNSAPTITVNYWYHVVGTYDGSGNESGLAVYINAVAPAQSTSESGTYTAMTASSAVVSVGGIIRNSNYFTGNIDEVSIYNKELSSAEVTTIYNLGSPINLTASTSPSDLIAWWRMGDGATYPTIPDDSTNSNSGTMTNMAAADIENVVPTGSGLTDGQIIFSYPPSGVVPPVGIGQIQGTVFTLANVFRLMIFSVTDGSSHVGTVNQFVITPGENVYDKYFILVFKFTSATGTIDGSYTNSVANYPFTPTVISSYDSSHTFNQANFTAGGNTGFPAQNIEETIIYNRALSDGETDKIKEYLNTKYNIY